MISNAYPTLNFLMPYYTKRESTHSVQEVAGKQHEVQEFVQVLVVFDI